MSVISITYLLNGLYAKWIVRSYVIAIRIWGWYILLIDSILLKLKSRKTRELLREQISPILFALMWISYRTIRLSIIPTLSELLNLTCNKTYNL